MTPFEANISFHLKLAVPKSYTASDSGNNGWSKNVSTTPSRINSIEPNPISVPSVLPLSTSNSCVVDHVDPIVTLPVL